MEQITWDSLRDPAIIAAVAALLMQILIKPILEEILRAATSVDTWRGYDAIVNLLTACICFGLAAWRLHPLGGGEVFVAGTIATSIATLGYEVTKNVFGREGFDVGRLIRKG